MQHTSQVSFSREMAVLLSPAKMAKTVLKLFSRREA